MWNARYDLDTFQLSKRADRRYSDTVDTQTSTSDTRRSFRSEPPVPMRVSRRTLLLEH